MSKKLYPMIECASMVALATVLSFIKIYRLPLEGEITLLSMLPICLFSIRWGIGWGFVGSGLYALIQAGIYLPTVMSWGLTPLALIGCLVFDYLLAYSILGIAGMFRKFGTWGNIGGIALALILRFASHLVSGTLIFGEWMPDGWGNPFIYSLAYNGSFMLPELVLTAVAAFFLMKIPAVMKKPQ